MVSLRVCGGVCGVVRVVRVVRCLFVCVCKSVRGKCRRNLTRHAISAVLLSPRTARQSEDCLRDARPTQSGASRTAGSAYGGGISRPAHSVSAELREAFWRRTAGYRARIRRKARNPTAPAQRGAWSEYLPSRRASAIAASCASRRLRLLRLVPPPPRLAPRKVGTRAPRECKAHGWRRSRGASGNACADILRIARAGWAALTTGPERILRRDAQDAARRRCRAQGERARPIDQAMQGALADGLRIAGKSGIRGGGVASRPRAANAPVPTARRIAPDSRAAFAQSGGGARRTHPKAIFRLSSGADGRAGTLCARGSTVGAKRCARCGGRAKALHTATGTRQGATHTAPHTPHTHENG